MITIHLITEHFLPTKGGLEEWTFRLTSLFETMDVKCIIYVCSDAYDYDFYNIEINRGKEIKVLKSDRFILEEPLTKSKFQEGRIKLERHRLNYNLIRNNIITKMKYKEYGKHILLSNFLIGTGFLAATISESLNIPHIACVVGTDYSRGFFNPLERNLIEFVTRNANIIVTKNNEQAKSLMKYSYNAKFHTIHTSLNTAVYDYRWDPIQDNSINLFSDCGFSNKKGTQILLSSFAKLYDEGMPVKLTICGSIIEGQEEYWNGLMKDYKIKYGSSICFHEYIEQPFLWQIMCTHSIYCSATLGEGSSHARAAAMCIGMPIVSTLCGEMADLADEQNHIKLSMPADVNSFTVGLRQMCHSYAKNEIVINETFVKYVREYFATEREQMQWKDIINTF